MEKQEGSTTSVDEKQDQKTIQKSKNKNNEKYEKEEKRASILKAKSQPKAMTY